MSEASKRDEPSVEEVAFERTIETIDAPDDQGGADAPFGVDEGESPFGDWLREEGITWTPTKTIGDGDG
jgi:hypothetical protein